MTTHSITVEHNFETAHRLPHLEGKCQSLHGHSWRAQVTVSAPSLTGRNQLGASSAGTVVEFGRFKKLMREWIDDRLDHGTMLGLQDPLIGPLREDGCKVFVFGPDWEGGDWGGAQWPTVEAVAALLAAQAYKWLSSMWDDPMDTTIAARTGIARVHVTETAVNAATWEAR